MLKLLSRVSVLVAVAGCILGTPLSLVSAPTALAQQPAPTATSMPPVPDAVLSNCYRYVRSQIPSLPMASEITSNTTPHVGAVAFFQYGDLPHYAIITGLTDQGFWVRDSNFGGPGIREHFIEWGNPHIRGFWAT